MLGRGEPVADYLPPAGAALLDQALRQGLTVDEESLFRQLCAAILRDEATLETLYQVEAGLHNRLIAAACTATGLEALIAAVKSRQLTRTRVRRILTYVLLGLRREAIEEALAAGPLYLHLLGCSARGRAWLAATRKRRQLPLVQNFSRVRARLKRWHGGDAVRCGQALRQLQLEERATRGYALLLKRRPPGSLQRDYGEELVRLSR